MKILQYLVIAFFFVGSISSCKVESETIINKDGSGSQIMNMEMSGMGMLAGMMEGMESEDEMQNEEQLEKNIEENINETEFEKLLEGDAPEDFNLSDLFNNPGAMGAADTTMNFYDEMPDSLKSHPKAHLMKNMTMKIVSDEGGDEMSITMSMIFDSQAQRKEIGKYLPLFISDGNEDGKSQGDEFAENIFGDNEIIDFEKGIVIIPEMDLSDEMGDTGLGGDEMDMEDEESKMMMSMLFGDSGMKSTYILPGDILFTSDHTAVIDGNKVTFSVPMMDLIEMDKIPKRIIKFKS